jgi:hypothetical protein
MNRSPAVRHDISSPEDSRSVRAFLRQSAIHQDLCVWFVFLSTLDVMLTWIMLHWGGSEVNALANWIIDRWDIFGLVAFKFGFVTLVICMIHVIARLSTSAARHVAEWAVALATMPVVLALVQLAYRRWLSVSAV